MESADSSHANPATEGPGRLTGKDAFLLHFTLAAGLTLCCGAFAFELWRALDGHAFSWMYVFEWPIFAAFAIYMWWNLLQGHDRGRPPPQGRSPDDAAEPDEDLAAWNRYVSQVQADEDIGLGRQP